MPDAGGPSAATSTESPIPQVPPTEDKTSEELVAEIYEFAAKLLSERTPREKVEAQLMERGLDRGSAGIVLGNLFASRAKALKRAGLKHMVYGALWCIGGIVLTTITGGQFIFYGAVLVGAYQAILGIYQYAKGSIGGRW